MKRKVFIGIIILAILSVVYYVKEEEERKAEIREGIERIDNQIWQLFEPVFKNTTFTIGEDRYILVMDTARFYANKEDYFNILKGEAYIDFLVYKNEIRDESLIYSGNYTPAIKRDSLEEEFYIHNNSESTSHIAKLFSDFVHVYYNYIYDLNDWESNEGRQTHSLYNEKLEFDSRGNLIKEGYIKYYNVQSSKNLDMVFATSLYINPDKEKLNIDIDVINLQKEFKKIYLTNEQNKDDSKEIILYYSDDESHYVDPLIIKKKDDIKSICIESTSVPSISPDRRRIAYIYPFEWEVPSGLYIYNIDNDEKDIVIKQEDVPHQDKVKMAKWLDDRYILTIIGFTYGTVTRGGDLYLYDTKDESLELVIDADSLDETLPKGRLEIKEFDIVDEYITMKIAIHDEEFMDYIVEERRMKIDDII